MFDIYRWHLWFGSNSLAGRSTDVKGPSLVLYLQWNVCEVFC